MKIIRDSEATENVVCFVSINHMSSVRGILLWNTTILRFTKELYKIYCIYVIDIIDNYNVNYYRSLVLYRRYM